jgi:hypothetical protein
MKITRYDIESDENYDHWIGPTDDGDYVQFEEYEKLRKALEKIHNYPDDPIWRDNRDDAANEIIRIAGEAIGLSELFED